MTRPAPVVPPVAHVGEADFRNAMVTGLARAQVALGTQRMLAGVMDLSAKQVGNIMAGGSTDPKRLWDVEAAVPGTLDDIAALYGRRIVGIDDPSCTAGAGKLSVATCALLAKAIDAEIDGINDHRELLAMENELRDVVRIAGAKLQQIAVLRLPTELSECRAAGGPGP